MGDEITKMTTAVNSLSGLIRKAADQLASATTAAEILDARDRASVAYDAARSAARLAKAKKAHDEIIDKALRAKADALEIELMAVRRLADEYTAAQERGEVATVGQPKSIVPDGNNNPATAEGLGISRKLIHEGRQIRDAEAAVPSIVRRHLDHQLASGQDPSKASLMRVIEAATFQPTTIPIVIKRDDRYGPDVPRTINIPVYSVHGKPYVEPVKPQPERFPADSIEAKLLTHFPADLLRRERPAIEAAIQSIAAFLESMIAARVERQAERAKQSG